MTSRIAFIHIPKTGGSNFVGKIINLWPKEKVSPYTGIVGFMTDPNPHQYEFTAGHVFYPKMKELLHPNTKFMTILRDPLERVYSHWAHVFKFQHTNAKTFEEFVYESYDSPLAKNLMSKYLGWWPWDFVGVPAHSAIIERVPMKLADDELFNQTMTCLEEYWYVGLQDKWVDVIQKVYNEFSLPLPPDTVQKELRNYRALMSDQLIADLEGFNQVDIKIYNYFKEK